MGARVTGIGEVPSSHLPPSVREALYGYEQVSNVCSEAAMLETVRRIQRREWVDRLESTVEAHILTAAKVREACGIPGTSVQTAYLCRDKPAMKDALRKAGVPCAQSTGAESEEEVRDFCDRVGYPVILKPRDAAGAAGTWRVDREEDLADTLRECGIGPHRSIAVEEFIEGHEAFYDTLCIGGEVQYDFITHYYPGVLEAMRTRWISPQFVTTNRVAAESYSEVKELGRKVIEALGIGTSATHMEWFFGPKGLKFSEIGCRPPGVGAWDLYCAANDFDLYREWANAIVHGKVEARLSRQYSAGIINLRPDRDGRIVGYEGLEAVERAYGNLIIDSHIPSVGTPTQPVEAGYMANAWIRVRHPDYDELRNILNTIGRTVQVRAA
ncbi:MAG: ATP-grasp domain-containing protein [Acidobacteriota bacterium]|nr:ATP-grasp domain-containing protein [Acidobacteriota bacterium]